MKKILSERNFAVLLFFVALVLFVFAQQDTEKIEKMYMKRGSTASSIVPVDQQPLTQNATENKADNAAAEE